MARALAAPGLLHHHDVSLTLHWQGAIENARRVEVGGGGQHRRAAAPWPVMVGQGDDQLEHVDNYYLNQD